MSKSITSCAVAKVARQLEALLDSIRESDPAYAAEMRHRFMLEVHDAVDRLDAIAQAGEVPAITGGAPDPSDFEEICGEFLEAPDEWPAYPDMLCDGVFYNAEPDHEGPLPLSVLALTGPRWEPRDESWAEMMEWASSLYSENDQLAAHGCV